MERVSSSSSVGEAVVVQVDGETDLRKGPWTVEEDLVLVNYIAVHGDGRWNSLARSAGLKRSGKSCRLRWLNYLRPDIRRGNFSPEEQLLILELHSRWGNRWSKIALHLPGRTDNEIKNYWRTRVQKHAKQLKCDVNSQQFKDAVRCLWMPRLMEKINAASPSSAAAHCTEAPAAAVIAAVADTYVVEAMADDHEPTVCNAQDNLSPDHSSTAGTPSDSTAASWWSSPRAVDLTDNFVSQGSSGSDYSVEFPSGQLIVNTGGGCPETLLSPCGYLPQGFPDFEQGRCGMTDVFTMENWWAADDVWFSQT